MKTDVRAWLVSRAAGLAVGFVCAVGVCAVVQSPSGCIPEDPVVERVTMPEPMVWAGVMSLDTADKLSWYIKIEKTDGNPWEILARADTGKVMSETVMVEGLTFEGALNKAIKKLMGLREVDTQPVGSP